MRKRALSCLVMLALLWTLSAGAAEPFRFRLLPTQTPSETPAPSPTPVPTPEPGAPYTNIRDSFPAEPGEAQKVLLSFLGDCTLGVNEIDHGKKKSLDYYVSQYGYDYSLQKVRYILEQDDLTVANLECVLSDTSDGLDRKTRKLYNFRGYEDYINILKEGSVEAVTVANNHIGDYGQPGFDATVRVLNGSGMDWFGSTDWGGQYFVFEQGNVRIGFVGSHVSYYWQHTEEMQDIFTRLREEEGCQVIIGVMHAGVEYDKRHDNNQTKLARRFIQWGADIVIGHHPHVLQGFEVLEGVPVYYSLGNFLFAGNFYLKTKYTVIMQLALSFAEDGTYLGSRANFIPCRLSEHEEINYYQPFPVTGMDAKKAIRQMQYDTKDPWLIRDYVENAGAMQDFMPPRQDP